MRALLAKQYNTKAATNFDEDDECLTNLFGSSEKGNIKASRLIFSDMMLSNWDKLKEEGLTSKTEIKWENAINRATAEANPRQIERAIRGSQFKLDIIYDVVSEDNMIKDFDILKNGFLLLQYDYLGGNGTRGYGKIRFEQLKVSVVVGGEQLSSDTLKKCQQLLDEVAQRKN